MLLLNNVITYYLPECGSTNDEIKKLYLKNHSIVVYTFNQTMGRGQYGKKWEMEMEKNLAISFTVKDVVDTVLLRYFMAILVRNFLIKYISNEEVTIKFPNDVYVRNDKISGILVEKCTLDYESIYIVGIGINVLQTQFSGLYKATSVFLHNSAISLEPFSLDFISFLSESNFEKDDIMAEINKYLWKKNKVVSILYENKVQNVIINQVNADGTITLELEQEERISLAHGSFNFMK